MDNKQYICRLCHKIIEKKDQNIIKRSEKYYYHKECFDNFVNMYTIKTDNEWKDLIFYLIKNLLKKDYNFFQIEKQINKMLNNNNFTVKGIYYSLYWFYIINNNQYNEKYGIGIVPYIYDQALQYWVDVDNKQKDILKQMNKIKDNINNNYNITTRKKKDRLITKEPIL